MTYMIDKPIFSTFAKILFISTFADLFLQLFQITIANLLFIKTIFFFFANAPMSNTLKHYEVTHTKSSISWCICQLCFYSRLIHFY